MAKSRSYSITYPCTQKGIQRAASKLGAHVERLERELDEVKRVQASLRLSCDHPRLLRGGDSYNGTWTECPDCGLNSLEEVNSHT